MASQNSGDKAGFWIQAPQSRREIFGSCYEEPRIAGPRNTLNGIMVASMAVVSDERRKFQVAIYISIWSRWRAPDFDYSTCSSSEMPAGRREGQSRDLGLEREVIQDDAAVEVGKNGSTVIVDGEKEVSAGVEG